MKFFKFILVLLITVSITGCSNNNSNEPLFVLSNANIAGTYDVTSHSLNTAISTTSNGITFEVGSIEANGDTFQLDLVMKSNGTFTLNGAYRVVAVTKFVSGDQVDKTEIINIDSSGKFSINSLENTITFSGTEGLLKGALDVTVFNENFFSLSKEEEVTDGNETLDVSTRISFTRQ